MTDQRPLSELEQLWIEDFDAETAAPYIRALNREIERLKVWGSDSHVTELEAKLAETDMIVPSFQDVAERWEKAYNNEKAKAEAAEKERNKLEHLITDCYCATADEGGEESSQQEIEKIIATFTRLRAENAQMLALLHLHYDHLYAPDTEES